MYSDGLWEEIQVGDESHVEIGPEGVRITQPGRETWTSWHRIREVRWQVIKDEKTP